MAGTSGNYRAALTGSPRNPPVAPLHAGPSAHAAPLHAGPSAHAAPDNELEFVRQRLQAGSLEKSTVDPFHKMEGEQLAHGSFRNHARLLVRGTAPLTLDDAAQLTVAKEIPFFSEHVVLARIIDGDIPGTGPKSWWDSLRRLAAPGVVYFYQRLGQRYSYIRTDGLLTTSRILAQGLHRFDNGIVLYQQWVRGFNLRMPHTVVLPMWVTFPELPLEYHKLACQLATQVGTVIAE